MLLKTYGSAVYGINAELITIEVVPVPFKELATRNTAEKSEQVRERVVNARIIQKKRYADYENTHCNAQVNSHLLRNFCQPGEQGLNLLKNVMEGLGFSDYIRYVFLPKSSFSIRLCL